MCNYQKILVLSLGRGVFWSEILKRVDDMQGEKKMMFVAQPFHSGANDFLQENEEVYKQLKQCRSDVQPLLETDKEISWLP